MSEFTLVYFSFDIPGYLKRTIKSFWFGFLSTSQIVRWLMGRYSSSGFTRILGWLGGLSWGSFWLYTAFPAAIGWIWKLICRT